MDSKFEKAKKLRSEFMASVEENQCITYRNNKELYYKFWQEYDDLFEIGDIVDVVEEGETIGRATVLSIDTYVFVTPVIGSQYYEKIIDYVWEVDSPVGQEVKKQMGYDAESHLRFINP
jgi:hypothetical protein